MGVEAPRVGCILHLQVFRRHLLFQDEYPQHAGYTAPVRGAVSLANDFFEERGKRRVSVCRDIAQRIPKLFFHAYARDAFSNAY